MNIQITKLDRPEATGFYSGSPKYHRWAVVGPDLELQKFPSKKEAGKYLRIRRTLPIGTAGMVTAGREYGATL